MEYGTASATGSSDLGNSNQPYQEFPHIVWDYYENESKHQTTDVNGNVYNNYYSGNVTFDASTTLYGIHFIDGNVTITADELTLHNATIFATGYIDIQTGNTDVILEKSDDSNPLSLVAKDYIEVTGNIHGEGIIQTESTFTLKGNANIQKGAIYADDGIFKGGGGSMNVYYDTDLVHTPVPGTGIPVWVKISWQEVY